MHTISPATPERAFEAWITAINLSCGRFRADTRPGYFAGELKAYESGAVRANIVAASEGTHLYRTSAETHQDNNARFFTVLQLRGESSIVQNGARTILSPGDMILVDAAQPFSVRYLAASRQVSLILPRQALERNLGATRLRCPQRIPAASPLACIARHLILGTLRQTRRGLSQPESEAALDALVHLLRPAIDSDTHQPCSERLQRALDFIEQHLDAEALTPEAIAQALCMSVRGLYRLFATQGLSVAQYIRNRRLDRCADTLRRSQCPQSLAAVGYACGFADASHFSTAFKNRFGLAPGEYRRQQASVKRRAN